MLGAFAECPFAEWAFFIEWTFSPNGHFHRKLLHRMAFLPKTVSSNGIFIEWHFHRIFFDRLFQVNRPHFLRITNWSKASFIKCKLAEWQPHQNIDGNIDRKKKKKKMFQKCYLPTLHYSKNWLHRMTYS